MEILSFFQKHKNKNKEIIIDNTLSESKIRTRKHLELHTKISSLAEETKCYKYWISDDIEINLSMIFQKYIDCFKHIIGIGIDKNYDTIEDIEVKTSDYCLSDQFFNLFIDLNDLIISPSEDHFITLMQDFLSLGISLGYSEEQISNALISQ